MQKNVYTEKTYNTVRGFYDEPQNSFDVLFLGSSHLFCDVNPLILFEQYGITSYELSTSVQRIENSYFFLNEFLKKQNPKIVFLECYGMRFKEGYDQIRTHLVYDYVPFSINKVRGIQEALVLNETKDEGIINYLLPIINYHTRWKSLNEEDFTLITNDKTHAYKGYTPHYNISTVTVDENKYNDVDVTALPERNITYLNRIIKLCKEKNISLVLFKTPSPNAWNQGYSNCLKEIAETNNIVFLDLHEEEIGIDYEKDFLDNGEHLNVYGATKLSLYLAEYINQNYDLENHKNDEQYDSWNQDLETYYTEINSKRDGV